jgi:phosphatidylserine decarboxylase
MDYRKSPIVIDGFFFAVPFIVLSVAFIFFSLLPLGIFFLGVAFFILWFFRNPERKSEGDKKTVLSPADGRVLKIEEVHEDSFLKGRFKKVSIFMSIFNVHVNRSPCSGIVDGVFYRKGKFFSANLDKASDLNESNSVLIRTEGGGKILVVQIAGIIARRIVCWTNKGAKLKKGERFGLIRFGSRLEVFVPLDTKIVVEVGKKVKAGETAIGYLA